MESSLIFRAVKLLGLLTIDKQFATVLISVPVNENLKKSVPSCYWIQIDPFTFAFCLS